ncbi:MAG TPA: helix-turn-helix domain-containing protein [Candidatus Saccharimonadales bacterium]|nr:helix-turn-helix domain-containing protein [Candidatus Saccharimonadales bacterium]
MNRRQERRSDCPIGLSLDVIGDRWSLLLVRTLMFAGERTFTELAEFREKIATNILAERLERLEAAGIVCRRADPADGRKYRYGLTDKGFDLMPVLLDLIAWGMKYNPDANYPTAVVEQVARDHGYTSTGRIASQKIERPLP